MYKKINKSILLAIIFLAFNFKIVYCSTTSGVYTYNDLSDGTINLVGYTGNVQNVIIPSTIDGKQISTIGLNAFKNNSSVKTIKLPEGVKIIDSYAFNTCSNLTNVYMPSTLKSISHVFYKGCPKLTYTIPDNLTKLSDGSYVEIATVTTCGTYNYDLANSVLPLVNEERAKLGLESLELNRELTEAAMQRAAETAVYWDHERPNSLQCFSVSSLIDGENIGVGTSSPQIIMSKWMNSPGHKRQIINCNYNSIGIGCYQLNGLTFWVQLFTETESSNNQAINGKTENVENKIQVKTYDDRLSLSIYGYDDNMTLSIGETKSPTKATITNKGYTSVKTKISLSDITWSSSNENVFTIDNEGKITAIGGGNAILTATLGESILQYNVYVSSPLLSISLPETVTLYTDYTTNLSVTYYPSNTTSNKDVEWSSNNTNVATVNNQGTITGISEGIAIITAKVEDKIAICNVIVKKSVKENIYFTKTEETIMISQETKTLDIVFEKGTNTIDDTITWHSSNSNIVSVDNNGNIRVLGIGKATITATTANGNIATCNINVIDYLKGDLNRDGLVNANDAAIALDLYKYGNFSLEDLQIGDINGDNVVNANDAALILDIYKYNN